MHAQYNEQDTMLAARTEYFRVNNFGDDGGYSSPWVDFHLGPLPMPIPNVASRVRAVKYHDLHHVLTGYDTNTVGEFEISAWEIGAGCKDFTAAWALNLSGTVAGLVVAPKRIFQAFVRGRRSQSLYGQPFEELLTAKVGELRGRFIAQDRETMKTTPMDVVLFAGSIAVGTVVGVAMAAVTVPLAPVGILWGMYNRAKQQKAV